MADIALVLGVLLVGIIFNTYLYGIVTTQFINYWKTAAKDRISVKAMILVLFSLDSVHSTAVLYLGWMYCIYGFQDPTILEKALWPYAFTPTATVAVAFVIQIFLGYRVYCLLQSKIIYGCIIIASLAATVLGVYCGVRIWIIGDFMKLAVLNKPLTAWLSIQAGVDLILSGLLIFCLARMKFGFSKLDHVVNSMMRGAIQTGVFSAIFALLDCITFVKLGHTGLCGMFAFPIGRLYTITLLDTLLSRKAFQTKLHSTAYVSSNFRNAKNSGSKGFRSTARDTTQQAGMDVKVLVESNSDATSSQTRSATASAV